MMIADRNSILEDEVIIVRNSGELPEIALYSSLYYLTEDPQGPGLKLRDDERQVLYDAAFTRAGEIIMRDLDPDNRDLSIYRGVARSIANWQRLHDFGKRMNYNVSGFKATVSRALIDFLCREHDDVAAGLRCSSVNCSSAELLLFCRELGLDSASLPLDWQRLCPGS